MASQLEIQKRNLESSILFMQQEHSNTLRGLHDEISKLQMKCAELTFQLTMKTTSGANDVDQAKYEKIEAALRESELQKKKAELEHESSDRAVIQAREQLRMQEKQFREEVKLKNQRIAALVSELEAQSGTIAYLTTELHKLKAMRRSRLKSATASQEAASPDPALPVTMAAVHGRADVAAPTTHQQQPLRPRHQLVLAEDSSGVRRRPASGQRLTLSHDTTSGELNADSTSASSWLPDPSPFLSAQREHSGDVVLKPTPPVLPPISTTRRPSRTIVVATAVTPAAATLHKNRGQHGQQTESGHRLDVGSSKAPNEVNVLAVGQVSSLRQSYAQEPGSADCK